MNITHYVDYADAYRQAEDQLACHLQEVSGCWSISGRDFCNECGLDYEQARDYEEEQEWEAMDTERYYEWGLLVKRLGFTPTDEQREQYEEHYANEWGWGDEGALFWEDVLKQLRAKYPQYEQQRNNEQEMEYDEYATKYNLEQEQA